MDDETIRSWRDGAATIEACLAKAVRADQGDAPFPLDEAQAAIWHQAQEAAYRHALEMMAPPGPEAGKTGGAFDGGNLGPFGGPGIGKSAVQPDFVPTSDQQAAITAILVGHRTIVAGASGTGRTTAAALAAKAWDEGPLAFSSGPALMIVQDEAIRMNVIMDHYLPDVHTHSDIRARGDLAGFLSSYGLIVIDDAGDGTDAGIAHATRLVLKHGTAARIARFVDAGPNDEDATVVMKQILRQPF